MNIYVRYSHKDMNRVNDIIDALTNYVYLDLSVQFNKNMNRLIQQLSEFAKETNTNYENKLYEYDNDIKALSKTLKDGNLTIICGAGVSIGAGVPSWNNLLLKLLESMMDKISSNNDIKLNNISVKDFNYRYLYSSLIVGKYLKTDKMEIYLPKLKNTYSSIYEHWDELNLDSRCYMGFTDGLINRIPNESTLKKEE